MVSDPSRCTPSAIASTCAIRTCPANRAWRTAGSLSRAWAARVRRQASAGRARSSLAGTSRRPLSAPRRGPRGRPGYSNTRAHLADKPGPSPPPPPPPPPREPGDPGPRDVNSGFARRLAGARRGQPQWTSRPAYCSACRECPGFRLALAPSPHGREETLPSTRPGRAALPSQPQAHASRGWPGTARTRGSRSAPSRPRALRESRVAGRGTHVRGRAALPRHLTWAMPEIGGQGRGRTGDLPLFRRTLVPTELPGRARACRGESHRLARGKPYPSNASCLESAAPA